MSRAGRASTRQQDQCLLLCASLLEPYNMASSGILTSMFLTKLLETDCLRISWVSDILCSQLDTIQLAFGWTHQNCQDHHWHPILFIDDALLFMWHVPGSGDIMVNAMLPATSSSITGFVVGQPLGCYVSVHPTLPNSGRDCLGANSCADPWEEIPQDTVRCLIRSMPRRCLECIQTQARRSLIRLWCQYLTLSFGGSLTLKEFMLMVSSDCSSFYSQYKKDFQLKYLRSKCSLTFLWRGIYRTSWYKRSRLTFVILLTFPLTPPGLVNMFTVSSFSLILSFKLAQLHVVHCLLHLVNMWPCDRAELVSPCGLNQCDFPV